MRSKRKKESGLSMLYIAQLFMLCVALIGIPAVAYVHLIYTVKTVKLDVSGLDRLEQKTDAGFAQVNSDMRILIERQYNVEKRVDELQKDVREIRKDAK